MANELDCSSFSNLLCTETEENCFTEDDDDEENGGFVRLSNILVTENEDEYIQMLIQKENIAINRSSMNVGLMKRKRKDWLHCARFDAIQWILQTKSLLGFCFQTAYLAITYFDQFLSKRSIEGEQIWAIRLLSVACLTIAAKMEECRVPALSEFSIDDYSFENKVIQRMELLVLNTLEWRMASITPLAYLHCFITKLSDESSLKDLVSRSVEHVLAFVKEINIMNQRPSTIAAAAVLAASNKGLTIDMVELKTNSLPLDGSLHNVDVFACYNLMLELEVEKTKTPTFVVSPDLSLNHSSSTDVIEDSFFASVSRTKRRRLTFDDLESNSDMHNERGF
ncbi:hypothetical protein ACHQM5_015692 [Ranunculus cassubicifolius]